MMRWLLIFSCLVAGVVSAKVADADTFSCASSKQIIGGCFDVHGRLRLGNGTPGFRMWPIGTDRMLGILDGEGRDETDDVIPASVRALFSGKYDTVSVVGDYEVCPLSRERKGSMRMVCIRKATRLRASPN
jgi:hypothetical protein